MAKPLVLLTLILLSLTAAASAHHAGGGAADDGEGDEHSAGRKDSLDLRSKSLILVKVCCLIIVFAATFAGGISPYFFKWNETFLVLGTQFAAGVFLATALIHFLSDANETFGDLTDVDYPFAFMLASVGFLVTMLADRIVASVVARGRSGRDVEVGQGIIVGNFHHSKPSSNGGGSRPKPEVAQGTGDHSVASLVQDASSVGDSILLIVALCFHSVFEGIAIGVAETKADAWKTLWTISLHKVFAAIAMGIALLRMMPTRPLLSCVSYAFAFAISSPIGVAIGIIIDETTEGRAADWIYAISMGLACGIFIYVSINHLIAKGYKPQQPLAADSSLSRWLAVVLGVGVIAVVMIWDT